MKFFDLFVHNKSVSKRKVCIIFIKNLKKLKTKKKKTFLVGIFRCFFWGFFGGFFLGGFLLQTLPAGHNGNWVRCGANSTSRPPLPPKSALSTRYHQTEEPARNNNSLQDRPKLSLDFTGEHVPYSWACTTRQRREAMDRTGKRYKGQT
jgi:hypothetical protein